MLELNGLEQSHHLLSFMVTIGQTLRQVTGQMDCFDSIMLGISTRRLKDWGMELSEGTGLG